MKNLKPIGIPHSIFLENLFAKTYDASKLEEDAERVRQAYHDKGYYAANVGNPETHLRDESGLSLITFRPQQGQAHRHHCCPSKRASATGSAPSPSPATRR